MFRTTITTHPEAPIYGARRGNQITREYYQTLVEEINGGIRIAAVCMQEHIASGSRSYYLISSI